MSYGHYLDCDHYNHRVVSTDQLEPKIIFSFLSSRSAFGSRQLFAFAAHIGLSQV